MELFFYTYREAHSFLSKGIRTHRDKSFGVFCTKVADANRYSPGYRVLRVKTVL